MNDDSHSKGQVREARGTAQATVQRDVEDPKQRDNGSTASGTSRHLETDELDPYGSPESLKKISVVAAAEHIVNAMKGFKHTIELLDNEPSGNWFWISCKDIVSTAYNTCKFMLVELDDMTCDNLKFIEAQEDGPVSSVLGTCVEIYGPNSTAIAILVSGFCAMNMVADSIM